MQVRKEYDMKKTKLDVAISVVRAVTVTLMAVAAWYTVLKKS
jgi:hypothetical protein